MKNWKELNIEELNNLTDEQINDYKELICKEAGIQLVEPQVKPNNTNLQKDLTVYYIYGLTSLTPFNCTTFTSLEEAKKVLECINSCKSFGHIECDESNMYFEMGTCKDDYDSHVKLTIKPIEVFSKEKYIKNSDNIIRNYELKQQNKELQIKINEVTKEFQNAIDNAYLTMAHRDLLAEKYYQDFLPICGNKSNIATEFLKNVYIVDDEDMKYILSHPIK